MIEAEPSFSEYRASSNISISEHFTWKKAMNFGHYSAVCKETRFRQLSIFAKVARIWRTFAQCKLSRRDYRDFVWAVAGLTHLARRLERGAIPATGGWDGPAVRKRNALTKIWLLLRNCPDEGMEASTASLEFIDDAELRMSIRLDVSSSEAAPNNGQWKAAAVLAGATVEALLLWSVTRHGEVERQSAVMRARVGVDSARPENRRLADYIEVAHELADITVETAAQARLAKEFRNLIHPGREVRKQMTCDRGSAHAALAALNLIIRDLENLSARGK